MDYFSMVIWMIAGVAIAAGGCRAEFRRQRFGAVAAGAFVFIGSASFFLTVIYATGGLRWIPDSFEWPVGWSDGVIKTSEGLYAVPQGSAGRVQIYDSNMHFIRGWPTETSGGVYAIAPGANGGVEVYTARLNSHHSYDAQGRLLWTVPYTGNYDAVKGVNGAKFMWIPTPWWGWTLTKPFIAWAVTAGGMVLTMVCFRRTRLAGRIMAGRSRSQSGDGLG